MSFKKVFSTFFICFFLIFSLNQEAGAKGRGVGGKAAKSLFNSLAKKKPTSPNLARSIGGSLKRVPFKPYKRLNPPNLKKTKPIGKFLNTLKPGRFAKAFIQGHRGRPTATEQRKINSLFNKNGCHHCGKKTPGTKSGNAVADHQPPQALGNPTKFYPQCIECMRKQGGQVRKEQIKRSNKL
jgi:hypothetical protein